MSLYGSAVAIFIDEMGGIHCLYPFKDPISFSPSLFPLPPPFYSLIFLTGLRFFLLKRRNGLSEKEEIKREGRGGRRYSPKRAKRWERPFLPHDP